MKYVVHQDENLNINENNIEIKKEKNKNKKPHKKHNFKALKPLRTAIVAFLIFTGVLGLGYTLSVTLAAQTMFPYESNGSVITITLNDGTTKVYGSELIGQSYLMIDDNGNYVLQDANNNYYLTSKDNEYFLDENANFVLDENEVTKLDENIITNVIFQANYLIGRFNQGAPSNSAVTTTIYKETIESRKQAIAMIGYNDTYNQNNGFDGVPSELLTESGSGCDPEISYETAMYQVAMIAEKRNIAEEEVIEIIDDNTKGRFLGIFGQKRVNVLLVNLQLDGLIK